ncbi:uncharacterized protein [Musca autumnalis]|uniref:uncharacterized protein n=1 Tax=Musca autumnalis TaxID=221902 RepID=UPI003CF13781
MVVRCNGGTTTTTSSSSTNCRRYLNQKCQRCSVLKRICKNIVKDYCRKLCREKYSVFEGGNSINIRIHRSTKREDSQEVPDKNPCAIVLDPCKNRCCVSGQRIVKNNGTNMVSDNICQPTRKSAATEPRSNKCSNSDQNSNSQVTKPSKVTKKDKGNQTQLGSNDFRGRNLDDSADVKNKKQKRKSKESASTDHNITAKEKSDVMQQEGESSKDKKKKNKKDKVVNDIVDDLQDLENKNERSSLSKKSKKKSKENDDDLSKKDLTNKENGSKTKNIKSKDKKSNQQEDPPNLHSKMAANKSPKGRTDAKPPSENKKKLQKLPKKIMVSNLIKDLRWKVRNGFDIRAQRGSEPYMKQKSHKKRKSFQAEKDKGSRFDEKPWDILRAAMEQREQIDSISKFSTICSCPCSSLDCQQYGFVQ